MTQQVKKINKSTELTDPQREEWTSRGKFTSWGEQWLLFQTGCDIILKDFGTGRSRIVSSCTVEDRALDLSIHLLIPVQTTVTAEVRDSRCSSTANIARRYFSKRNFYLFHVNFYFQMLQFMAVMMSPPQPIRCPFILS